MVQSLLGSVGSQPSGGFGGINEEEGPHNVLPQIEHASTLVDRGYVCMYTLFILFYTKYSIYIYIYIMCVNGILFLFRSSFFRLHSVVNFFFSSFVVVVAAVEFLHHHRWNYAHSGDRPQRDRRPLHFHLRY